MGLNRVAPIITGQSNAQTIKGSLRFDSSLSQNLSYAPGSATNRKTWTWSGWVKKTKTGDTYALMGAGTGSLDLDAIDFNGERLRYTRSTSGSFLDVKTDAVHRDPSAWYHVVVAVDTTQGTSADRVKLYVNGVQQTSLVAANYPSQDELTFFNSTETHILGRRNAHQTNYFDGYMSNVTFIDGQALGPGFFGFNDPLTGTWRPKRLKDGAPTVNNGTVFSSYLTTDDGNFDASFPKENAFDGNTSTRAICNTAVNSTSYIQFNSPVPLTGHLIVRCDNNNKVYDVSGGKNVLLATQSAGSDNVAVDCGFVNNLTNLRVLMISSSRAAISAIYLDGILMTDSTTTNVDFGTNGFYLPLDDQDDYTTDKSGKGNNWTANGFTGTSSNPDVVPDSPSGVVGSTKPTSGITTTSSITKPTNYATWNPVGILKESGSTTSTLSDGNLKITFTSGTNASNQHFSTIGPSSGKWYCEWTAENDPSSNSTAFIFGVQQITDYRNNFLTQTGGYAISSVNQLWNNGSNTNSWWSGTAATGDTFALALDLTNSQITFYRNGSSLGDALSIPSDKEYAFCMQVYQWQGTPVGTANFGQRPFKHQPPAGYLTLCSANARPSTVVTRPDQYVGIATYNGNNGTQNINVGLKPDLVWIKNRHYATSHAWFDSVRGANQYLSSNATIAEFTPSTGGMTSFNNDGFTVVSNTPRDFNSTGDTYVAWCWKAGGNKNTFNVDDVGYASAAAAGLTAGTITPTGASVGTKQGFSIITWTGTSASGTVPHGLGTKPSFIIGRRRNGVANWCVYHISTGASQGLNLQSTAEAFANTTRFGGVEPTSTVFSVGSSGDLNAGDALAYCWADVPGLQKFGSYIGNSSTDGPFLEMDFVPKLIIFKIYDSGGVDTGNWRLYDTERRKYNVSGGELYPNRGNVEETTITGLDILSNGVKLRISGTDLNYSGYKYVYAAWAAAPAHNLFGGQSLAR